MKKLTLLAVALFIFSNIYAEKRIVSGIVLLNNQFALGNITVSSKKAKAIVSTNNKGEFSIVCEEKDVLFFEAEMFRKVRRSVKGIDSLIINMSFIESELDKKKMVDKGFIQFDDIESVAKAINSKNYDFSRYTSVKDLISVKFPFVNRQGRFYVIRGPGSIMGNNAALLVVNGVVVGDFSSVDPNQIKSIKVLKNTEAVLYGNRGINGVIEIVTK